MKRLWGTGDKYGLVDGRLIAFFTRVLLRTRLVRNLGRFFSHCLFPLNGYIRRKWLPKNFLIEKLKTFLLSELSK